MSVKTLAMFGLGSVFALTAKALEGEQADGPPADGVRKIDTESPDGVLRIFSDDLEAILGDELASKARAYQPLWTGILRPDRGILGMADHAVDQDVLDLAERRGVLVDGRRVDRHGLELLAKLLPRERKIRSADDDICSLRNVARHLAEIVRTPVSLDPLPERPKPRWNPFAPRDARGRSRAAASDREN